MAGDIFRKLKAGEDLNIPEGLYSILVDVCKDYRAGRLGGRAAESRQVFRQTGIVKVKNNSGADVPRFGVLGASFPLIDPVDNLEGWASEVVFSGVTPTVNHKVGYWVVTRQTIAAGAIGEAYIDGACPAKVNVTDVNHFFADCGTTTANLVSSEQGSARILWVESGTGVKRAYVVLQSPSSVKDIRYNTTTKKIQVSYTANPQESDWVDKITAGPCP